MTCDRNTARCPDARSYDHALRPCCRQHVIDIMRNVAAEMDRQKVVWWADYGTLLGAVRNPLTSRSDYPWLELDDVPIAPGIVPHDKDADLGVLHTHWGKAVQAVRDCRRTHKYDVVITAYRGSMKVRLSPKNHTNVDLFFWHEKPDGTMFRRGYAQVDAFKGREFHRDILFPLGTVEWEGLTLPAPRDPEAFLAMRYGPNWRTPVAANHDGVRR